ncbi:hypothetical protein GSU3601 [Geobacter sulfurreducens PCA]|uniref:Uncharacterized protein n=1 Tax=Geobacter sulfurreducens (strain ATCC 51573 / DSM 12127 / PCA) TaxID=243231 RepID=I7F9N8_GEOSL|nr:hypothetical protein GSU3601 [Geobacter sulfurreducens PCA]HBB68762.1 hypothetical protein [Geobacter sulfurreducens]HCD94735.1 hypothetical protein [Geobacter sulfurreducens]
MQLTFNQLGEFLIFCAVRRSAAGRVPVRAGRKNSSQASAGDADMITNRSEEAVGMMMHLHCVGPAGRKGGEIS